MGVSQLEIRANSRPWPVWQLVGEIPKVKSVLPAIKPYQAGLLRVKAPRQSELGKIGGCGILFIPVIASRSQFIQENLQLEEGVPTLGQASKLCACSWVPTVVQKKSKKGSTILFIIIGERVVRKCGALDKKPAWQYFIVPDLKRGNQIMD